MEIETAVIQRQLGHYEREFRGDLHNHKMNANNVSIYNTKKLLTYMQNRITDYLDLDECMIWTLDFEENNCSEIQM